MRFRRKRFGRAKRKTEWISGASGEGPETACLTPIGIQRCEDAPFNDSSVLLFSLVDNVPEQIPGNVETMGEVTIVRIVGEIWFALLSSISTGSCAFNVTTYMGIYHTDSQTDGTARVLNPAHSDDQGSKDWLWRGTCSFSSAIASSSGIQVQSTGRDDFPGSYGHIDIRVKRKLKRLETIVLAVLAVRDGLETSLTNLTQELFLGANIRVLGAMP